MEEPARLVCPQCALVYRLKKITPGRTHACKNCGAQLMNADAPAAGAGGSRSVSESRPAGSDLARLPKLIEKLAAQLDAQTEAQAEAQAAGASADSGASTAETEKLLESFGRLEENVQRARDELGGKIRDLSRELDEKIDSKVSGALDEKLGAAFGEKFDDKLYGIVGNVAGGITERLAALDDKIAAAAKAPAAAPEEISLLRNALEAGQADILRKLDDQLSPGEQGKTTVEVDIDELADRLVAGVRGRGPMYDAETETAVDALARLADQLVREQNANTARLDKLATEIHDAIGNIAKLEEWQTELPDRVADEIGATVEARVVGPISGALARQAPSILSELQDSKLVDIVSRSVREAQRPLLREILAGGRNGVPVWLFASVLLPLLLILGYLFLPGEIGGYGGGAAAAAPAELTDALARIETTGIPLTPDAEDRLLGIEEAVLDIHNQALSHVRNAAALEEEVKNLRRLLEERDSIISEYTTTLERQTKRLQAYEFRLVQLGVKPDAVAGQ